MKRHYTFLMAAFLLLALFTIPIGMRGQTRAEEVYSTCLFGSSYNPSNSSYTSSFEATNGDFTWTIVNGNNNNNSWTNSAGHGQIKFGRKNNASVGQITTKTAYSEAISKVELTIDALTASKINSIKLYSGTSATSITTLEGEFEKTTGTKTVAISNPEANKFYDIKFDCASGTSNGLITVSMVQFYYTSGNPSVVTPSFNPDGGSFLDSQEVSISCATDGATIYYTTNGNDPTTSSNVYSAPFTITSTTTVKAFAVRTGYDDSTIASATFTKTTPMTVAEAIAATPSSGTSDNVYIQGIVSKFHNTSIMGDGTNYRYYISDDGTTTNQLLVYRGNGLNNVPFSDINDLLLGDQVIIYGQLTMYQNASEVAQGNYIYSLVRPVADVETPTFSPAAGTYATAQSVTIECENPDVDIYYTLDGSDPTEESMGYYTPITVNGTTTIKAIAIADDMESAIATATYYICSQDNPYTVTQALNFAEYQYPANNVYVHGIVSTAPTSLSSGALTYYISVDGTATNELEVYKGKGLNNEAFTAADDIQVGDIVTIYGNVQVYNGTIEFGSGNYLVEFERPASTEPSITVEPATVNATADGANGTLSITYENIPDLISFDIQFCDANGDELSGDAPDWVFAAITEPTGDEGYSVSYSIDSNDGEARTAYFKVYTFAGDKTEQPIYSNLITINQAAYVAPVEDYATLPFAFDGGRADIANTSGLTQDGLDTDYAASPKLKFKTQGTWVILHFNESPGVLTFDIKGNSFSGGVFTVQTSEDGVTYTNLKTYTTLGSSVESEEFNNLGENVRYIKWIYTTKSSGNVALGNITLAIPTNDPTITVADATVELDADENEGTMAITYTNLEIVDMTDFDVQYYDALGQETTEPDWIEALVAEEIDGSYVVSYFVNANNGEARTAYFKVYVGETYSNLITISQAAPVAPPTGDEYALYTGALVEGDYLIVYDGGAMNTTVTNERLQYEEVSATNDVIVTDNAEIIWHIAPSGDYWTIYNADADAYAASTGAKNKAQMIADGTDDKALWTVSGTETYEFVNKKNTDNSVNANLRKNGTYGFACYAETTGGPLSLYKKVEASSDTYPLTINGYGNNNEPSHYYLIASPVTVDLSNHALTTGDFDLYYFDQTQASEWRNYKANPFNLEPGKGYLYAHKTGGTFELSGTAYEGNGTVTLVKDDNAPNFPGWNLVGNPYGDVAYIQDGRDFYVLTDGSEVLPYDGNDIQPLQGIFVVATNNNESMTFTTTAPASTGEKFVFNISQGRGDVIDRAMVRFGEGRTLPKFQLHDTSTKLYIPQADDDYAVVYATEHGTLPLNFRAAENGAYTLSFDNQAGEFASLHLIDNKTRADIDLLTNPSYTFNAETTDDENRFTLVYSKAGDLTVTVCDGTNTNSKIPVNGLYADTEGTTSEFIIPSTMDNMETLVGATITGMTFYINTATTTWGQTTIEVYMGEVDYTTLSSLQGPDDFTVVSTQDWDNTGSTIELVFDVPYEYGGGNLLIGTRVTACDDSYKSTPFVGTEGAAGCSRYNNGGTTETSQSFLPKTTFTYEEAAQGDCEKPTTVTASDVEAHSATLSWEGGSTPGNGYNVEVKGGQYTDWTRIYSNISQGCELTDLQDNTSYQARVQVVCSAPNEEEEASGWTIGRFTTPIACPAPTSLAVTLTPGDGTVAEFSWTENGEAISWQLCINDDENNLIDMDENPFTYDEFTPEQTYTAKVRAYCNDIDQSEWSNTVTFTPTDAYTITVNDSDNTNGFVPVYGYYVDATSMSQFIIPATDLEDMQWGTINKLTFYASQSNVAWAGTDYYGDYKEAAFEVYMAEVDHTTFTDGTPVWDGMLKVMDAALLGISDHQMEVTLDAPYQYMGGNLMIGIKQTASGLYGTSTWYGVNQTENTAIGNKSNSGTTQELKQFLPKTTFSYIPGEEPDCVTPQGLAVSSITNETAVATWSAGEAVSWNLKYRMIGEEKRENEWITENDLAEASYPFENLEAGTTYEVQVQANCGDALSEYCNAINFTTDFCAADDKCVVTLELTDAYGDGWGGATLEVVDAETNITIGTYTLADGYSETYIVNVCPDRTINFVYTPGNWAYENGYVFTDINNEVIASHEGCSTQGSCDAPTTGVVASYLVSCRPATCARPAGLVVTPSGSYAEVTWEAGEAESWEVCVDDDEENIIRVTENSCTIEHLDFTSDHTVRVRAYCGEEDGYSTWTQNMSFTTNACDDACSISYVLTANAYQGSYSYGWYYSGIKVLDATTGDQIAFWTVDGGNATSTGTLTLCPDTRVTFQWYSQNAGNDQLLVGSYAIYDHLGDVITEGSGPMSEDVSYTMDCTMPDCMWPTNITVEPSYTSATISWDGEETNTYNVQYRTAPVVFYDGFEYGLDNWTILVQGEVPSSGDFANGWATYGEASHSGNKTAASRSWVSDGSQAGLTLSADNWLISPMIEIQGTLKFWVKCSYPNNADEYEVLLSTSGTAIRDFSVTLQDETAATGDWEPIEIDLSRYAGNRGYIAIRHHFTDGELLFVDDFGVYGPEETAGRWKDERITGTSIELVDLDMDSFYEFLIQNDCGNTQSDWKGGMFQTLNGNEKQFIHDGDWNKDDNWIPEGVPTAGQNATIKAAAIIPAGCVATIDNITITEDGSLLIRDGGQLVFQTGEVTATVEKNITGYKAQKDNYYLISTGMAGMDSEEVEGLLTNNYDYYWFDGSADLEWRNYESSPFNMKIGWGYLYANSNDDTLRFTGELLTPSFYYVGGSNSSYLTYDETKDYGTFNLVGNAFVTDGYISLYDANGITTVTDFYVMGDNGELVPNTKPTLSPNEGVFIEATQAQQLALTSIKEYNTKSSNASLNMTLTSANETVDRARIRFGEGHGLRKLQLNKSRSKLYMPVDNNDYAVVRGEAMGEMPVNFKAEQNGNYTLSFNNEEVTFSYLHLIDNLTGADVDLLTNPSYSFDAKMTDYASRFKLVYATGNTADSDNFGFISNNHLMILGLDGQATLKVMDVTGRTLSVETFSGSYDKALNLSNGVYMLQLIQGNNVKTQKIVVK